MATALRVRVWWDATLLSDGLYFGRLVRIGAGERAQVAAPHAPEREGRYVILRRRGRTLAVTIEAGAAEAIEFPGEEPISVEGRAYSRVLVPPYGSGCVRIGDARVEFERVRLAKEARDRALWAWSAAAMLLALLGGSGYQLVRAIGNGDLAQWGKPKALDERDARGVRVKLGPDGAGAMRPQAGQGVALAGVRHAPVKPQKIEPPRPHKTPRVARAPKIVTHPVEQRVDRDQSIASAQAALLRADLRQAVEGFSRAATVGPLDYDQLNWLGLAEYLSNDLDAAEHTWASARANDPSRADAINNLAAVAKRRGDGDRERQLLDEALALDGNDCHATNSLALFEARDGRMEDAMATLARSDASCGGNYAYTSIQRAAILALRGDRTGALAELEKGLARVDTLVPIKEFEVWTDLRLDPAFASLRAESKFKTLVAKYLPRASSGVL
jgi:Tfp pilus assembly protein PilF